jgi:rubrerythrin
MGIIPVDIGGNGRRRGSQMLDEVGRAQVADGDFVEFVAAGSPAEGEYHCSSCGYGVSVRATLPQCPMCSGVTWEPADWSGLTRQRYQA